jgi:UDP-2-acetamido-2,6-beta-L-arabino-hexul-4-ose reductase
MKKLKRYPLKKSSDERGWLIQSEHKEIAKSMKYFLVSFSKPGVIRGNHYHKRKKEWFSILQGKVKLYLYDLKTKEKGTYIISSEKMEFVEMEPNVAHAIKNIGEQELIFFEVIDEPFNPKDPDTFPYILK